MGLVAQPADFERELPPEDTELGCCIQVIDLGHQYSEKYHKTRPMIWITWELVQTEMQEGDNKGKPFVISKEYGNTTGQKSHLVEHYSIFGAKENEPFNVSDLLGEYALISVVHKKHEDKTYANINSISKLLKGMKKEPKPKNDLVLFDIDEYVSGNKNTRAIYDKLPEFLQKKIDNAVEVTGVDPANDEPPADNQTDPDEDVPL